MNSRTIVGNVFLVLTAPVWVPLRILVVVLEKLDNIKLFEIKGVPTYLSSSLVIFISMLTILSCLPDLLRSEWWTAAVSASEQLLTWVVLYALVVAHEYGHSLTARHLGYGKEAKVTLYPFAGLASIDGHWHKNPKHEFWIILNGPATNLVMALLAWPFVAMLPGESLLLKFFEWNVVLLAFNALPIFPMDGGRVVRCWLTAAFDGDWVRSTFWTAAWTTVALLFLCPLLWVTFSPVASVLITIMALMGWGEYFGLKQLRDEPKNRAKMVRDMFWESAEAKYPDDKEKQEAFIQSMLQIDKFMQEIASVVIRVKRPPKNATKEQTEECAKAALQTVEQVFAYIYQMSEDERLDWNRRYNFAEAYEDGGTERERILLEFIDRVMEWAAQEKMDESTQITVDIVEITDPNDVMLLSSMRNCTIKGEMVLPSGTTIPAAPEGKCWHVNDGVVAVKDLEDGE